MDIVLGYIEGISRVDTPYFTSGSEQRTYFEDHEVETITTTFYPPHYNNTIRFDIADVNFNTQVNYLWFEFNNKVYYYFIDDVVYINESLIELYVTLDYIQTYMFNIYVQSGIIERKHINRWIQREQYYRWFINRSYIRENLSSNEFKVKSKNFINTDSSKYVLFLKQSKVDKTNSYGNWAARSTVTYWKSSSSLSDKFPITSVVPYDLKFGPGSVYSFSQSGSSNQSNLPHLVATGAYLAESLDMYICPFNPFSNIDISSPNLGVCTLTGNITTSYINFDDMHGETVYYHKPVGDAYNILVRRNVYNFDYARNASINVPFSSSYITQMFDDNYERLMFGTSACSTSHPLYVLDLPNINCRYTFDISNGSRIYYLTAYDYDNLYTEDDIYNTMVIDTNILSIDLKNSPWAQYIANNKNRWAQLSMSNISEISRGFLSVSSGSKYGKIGSVTEKNIDYNFARKRDKKGRFTKGSRRIGSSATTESRDLFGEVPSSESYTGLASGIIGSMENVFNQYYTEKNLESAPSTLSQLGEAINGFVSHAHLIFQQHEQCVDYEQCANYYHRYGYLINEYVSNIGNIFAYVQNRYYFNILKMSDANVHLHNVIEDEFTLTMIKDRLDVGFRLWRPTYVVYNKTASHSSGGSPGTKEVTFDLDDFQLTSGTIIGAEVVSHTNCDITSISFTSSSVTVIFSVSEPSTYSVSVRINYITNNVERRIGDFTFDNVELDYL